MANGLRLDNALAKMAASMVTLPMTLKILITQGQILFTLLFVTAISTTRNQSSINLFMIWSVTWVVTINATLANNGTMLWRYTFVQTQTAIGKYVAFALINPVPHSMPPNDAPVGLAESVISQKTTGHTITTTIAL